MFEGIKAHRVIRQAQAQTDQALAIYKRARATGGAVTEADALMYIRITERPPVKTLASEAEVLSSGNGSAVMSPLRDVLTIANTHLAKVDGSAASAEAGARQISAALSDAATASRKLATDEVVGVATVTSGLAIGAGIGASIVF